MSFASQASNLLTNKYFLYFIVFLAASNVLGYLVTNNIHAVIFFALIGFLMSNFSKNMAVVLLVAIIATNLLMVNKSMREGMTNDDGTTSDDTTTDATTTDATTTDATMTDGHPNSEANMQKVDNVKLQVENNNWYKCAYQYQ